MKNTVTLNIYSRIIWYISGTTSSYSRITLYIKVGTWYGFVKYLCKSSLFYDR